MVSASAGAGEAKVTPGSAKCRSRREENWLEHRYEDIFEWTVDFDVIIAKPVRKAPREGIVLVIETEIHNANSAGRLQLRVRFVLCKPLTPAAEFLDLTRVHPVKYALESGIPAYSEKAAG